MKIDPVESGSGMESDGIHAGDDDDGSSDETQQLMDVKCDDTSTQKIIGKGHGNNLSRNEKAESDEPQQLHRKTSKYRYECEPCKTWFSAAASLAQHFREEHSGERPFKCQLCNDS